MMSLIRDSFSLSIGIDKLKFVGHFLVVPHYSRRVVLLTGNRYLDPRIQTELNP